MKKIFLVFCCFNLISFTLANNILVGVTGIAKVGENCFLSMTVKDNSNLKIKELKFTLFTTDKNNSLLGKAKINLFNLNKFQPYTTSIPVNIENSLQCGNIRNVKIFNNLCTVLNKKDRSCKNIIEVDKSFKDNHSIKTSILKSPLYFKSTSNENYYVKELNVSINIVNAKFAKKYNISHDIYGLVVTEVKEQNIFEKGDLIFEAELKEVRNIKEFKKQLENASKENKEYILINFIRKNNKKLVAVKLK